MVSVGIGAGKTALAHRVAYEITYGEIPDGLCVLHKCDNRLCVNPHHLYLGTHADNVKDKIRKGRQPRGEKHGRAKLTVKEVVLMRKLHDSGDYTYRKLADLFPVSAAHTQSIVKGEYWKLPLVE